MKNVHCVICSKNRKFEKPKISYVLEKIFLLSIIWLVSVKIKIKNIFKEESIEALKILGLI